MKNKNKLLGSFQSINCRLVCDRKRELGKEGGKINQETFSPPLQVPPHLHNMQAKTLLRNLIKGNKCGASRYTRHIISIMVELEFHRVGVRPNLFFPSTVYT